MAKVKVKVIATVDIPKPKSLEKQSATELNEAIREVATEKVLDALQLAELNPYVLRARIVKGEKDNSDE